MAVIETLGYTKTKDKNPLKDVNEEAGTGGVYDQDMLLMCKTVKE